MIPDISVEELQTLAKPFEKGGATSLFFARHGNRVYCGRVPARRIEGEEGEPVNIEKAVPLSEQDYRDIAESL